jgi:hypothetical protein
VVWQITCQVAWEAACIMVPGMTGEATGLVAGVMAGLMVWQAAGLMAGDVTWQAAGVMAWETTSLMASEVVRPMTFLAIGEAAPLLGQVLLSEPWIAHFAQEKRLVL